jgi:TonB family protein
MKFFWLVLVFVPVTCFAGNSVGCGKIDPLLVACDPPHMPNVRALGDARVVLKIHVKPNGAVSGVQVLSFSGDTTWKQPLLQAVSHWRYKPLGHAFTKVVPFNLGVSDGAA